MLVLRLSGGPEDTWVGTGVSPQGASRPWWGEGVVLRGQILRRGPGGLEHPGYTDHRDVTGACPVQGNGRGLGTCSGHPGIFHHQEMLAANECGVVDEETVSINRP